MSIWWMPSSDHRLKGVKLEQRASVGSRGFTVDRGMGAELAAVSPEQP